ncbi:MAG: tripartite tricarboxylate transporter substrate binding protein [Oceanospirillaceae bacterium]|jgi:tripartite-type tricarboxylate transporter receptor subunit TctC|nr:tripartite tricarboxylate transporter substrate binding protein [Oceanospirillaceae bacterium]MBT4443865.1 tripartite tricarboxylate transporter substrate binding protein [Oceanospirillaceae bacterium]MBT6076916.1 tripartite tricarboxylate transporter substrate binding protein [Oceanospirillaceae bacterium]MBT7331086.1 tripartite tricarboxylate transporter substrate binding protein [Oceanospirillaceae bacterium]
MHKLLTLAAAVAVGVMSSVASAADYPSKPVSFIVPFPPGDLEDVLTRMIAEDFQAAHGVASAVINKPGGGGGPFPGAEFVANADPDGSVVGSFVIGVPVVGPNIGFDWLDKDTFEPLGIFVTYPFILAAAGDAPYDDIQGMADHAKTNELVLGHFGAPLAPTQVSFAAAGALGFEWGSEAAFDMLDCNTLASGDADVINTTIQLVLPCLDKIKVLASITNERISLAPDAPTMGEVVPALDISLWNGLFVTKGTSDHVKQTLIASAKKTMASDRAQAVGTNTGALVYWMDADDAAAQIAKDRNTMVTIGELTQ